MRSILLVLLILLVSKDGSCQRPGTTRVEAILERMTLEEKVGQMTQINIDLLMVGEPFNLKKPNEIDPAKVQRIIGESKVGSILNAGGYTYSQEFWYEIHEAIQAAAGNIPVIYGVDAIHGVNYTVGGTLFPQQLAQAATWNLEMVEAAAAATAYETRASGIPWNFSPVLDLGRQPLWSRFFETFGEDVLLVTAMGQAMIAGYQGQNLADKDRVAACLKHFLGYSMPFSGKDRTPVYMSERVLREYFLPTFKAAIDAGAASIMVNSGELNGIPVHADKRILTDLLRDELRFEGVVLTDWEDIIKLHNIHRVAPTQKEAVRMAIDAGVDMSMVPLNTEFCDHLIELVKEGAISEERIDASVRRILTLKEKLGLFETPFHPMESYPLFSSKQHAELARNVAREAITLLKNENGRLPLDKKSDLLVTGPGAHSLNMLNGAWTHTWQGTDAQYNTPGKATVYDALKDLGQGKVKWVEGSSIDRDVNTADAIAAAGESDVVIACIGDGPSTEKPGDIVDLNLPEAQSQLVKAVASAGKPLVLVLTTNRPRIIRELVELADAVVMAYQPGDEGGAAIAEVLYGDVNPSGKLPFTYPRYANDIVFYDHKYSEELDTKFGFEAFDPQFEFGSGMSYTEFEYSNLRVERSNQPEQAFLVQVDVQNTGKRAGKETVQCYVRDMYASITPPVKQLKGFAKIDLQPGEKRTVDLVITRDQLAIVGADNLRVVEPGEFEIQIQEHKASITYP